MVVLVVGVEKSIHFVGLDMSAVCRISVHFKPSHKFISRPVFVRFQTIFQHSTNPVVKRNKLHRHFEMLLMINGSLKEHTIFKCTKKLTCRISNTPVLLTNKSFCCSLSL